MHSRHTGSICDSPYGRRFGYFMRRARPRPQSSLEVLSHRFRKASGRAGSGGTPLATPSGSLLVQAVVSLARALALQPSLLLLDEPPTGLDAEARQAFFDDLETALADRGTTVVHVSHRAEETLRLADRVAVLSAGTVRQLGDLCGGPAAS
jgi:ABC-type sugar transport system ATPase subunit